MSITVPADAYDAFSHLFLVGLASIVEEEKPSTYCALRWGDSGTDATLRFSTPTSLDDMTAYVHSHAAKYNSLPAMTSDGEYDGSNSRATMSPRLSNIVEPSGWKALQHDRQTAIDALDSMGECRYFGALGQPSYWSGRASGPSHALQADYGASRWEMVARNKGQEFISGRLRKLSQIVTDAPLERIRGGINGEIETDECGENKPISRTATGLHAPSLTDNVRAWCALIGVSAFPVIPSVSGSRDCTAGLFQISRKGSYAVLPVFTGEWTLQRFRSVARSATLLKAGASVVLAGGDSGFTVHDDWLAERNVIDCVLFRQFVSDNKNAPERWLERGTFIPVRPVAKVLRGT